MVTIKEALSKKERRDFLELPLRMYKDNPFFVPPLYSDEKKIFSPDYVYYDTCEAVYYVAYDEKGECVGRISGILQKASNEKNGEKRVRFTRFDCINDRETAAALFGAVEKWALSKGMDTVCGPLGFSDLEREGLLIEGFDQLSTFEEQYNAEYYPDLVEYCGYTKEVDWFESRLSMPEDYDGSLERMSEYILKRYNLHLGKAKNVNDFLKKYGDAFFDLLDRSYAGIYGVVPFTPAMRRMMEQNFRLIIDLRFVAVILDENGKLVLLGICFPSIAEAVRKSGGRLTPGCIARILKAKAHPEIIDLGLVGVDPEYVNRGISTVVCAELIRMFRDHGVKYAETNLNLEDNYAIRNQWKRFSEKQHKKRRSYKKVLTDDKDNR